MAKPDLILKGAVLIHSVVCSVNCTAQCVLYFMCKLYSCGCPYTLGFLATRPVKTKLGNYSHVQQKSKFIITVPFTIRPGLAGFGFFKSSGGFFPARKLVSFSNGLYFSEKKLWGGESLLMRSPIYHNRLFTTPSIKYIKYKKYIYLRKILHTGDTKSLNRCGQQDQYKFVEVA